MAFEILGISGSPVKQGIPASARTHLTRALELATLINPERES